jgi:hypothetical protein
MMDQTGTKRAGLMKSLPWKLIAGVAIGGSAGFLYYYFVGCATGACPLTSNPYTSVLYGAVMGALISRA